MKNRTCTFNFTKVYKDGHAPVTLQRYAKKNLSFFTINFQSIKNKIAELHALIEGHQPDIIVGTETWLYSDISNSEKTPQGYITIKQDRNGDSHGGVIRIWQLLRDLNWNQMVKVYGDKLTLRGEDQSFLV